MDNRNLSPNELSVLRSKAVESVVIHGLTQSRAGQIFGFSPTSMCKYIKAYKLNQDESFRYEKRGLKVGMRRKMQASQEENLIRDILSSTPDQLGLNYTLWNSKVVEEYISSKYSLIYNRRSIRKIMTRLGFSSQKPIKLAYQRDPKKIEAWLSDIYPQIKLRAMQEGARIYWGDEMGVQATDNGGRTYGLKGKKPITKKTGSRFKCNMLAAISPQGLSLNSADCGHYNF